MYQSVIAGIGLFNTGPSNQWGLHRAIWAVLLQSAGCVQVCPSCLIGGPWDLGMLSWVLVVMPTQDFVKLCKCVPLDAFSFCMPTNGIQEPDTHWVSVKQSPLLLHLCPGLTG